MNWIFNPKNAAPICVFAFVFNAGLLIYEILKTPNPNNPIGALDNIILMPSLAVSTVCLGIGSVYLLLKKDKK